jgi:hypothetical protein
MAEPAPTTSPAAVWLLFVGAEEVDEVVVVVDTSRSNKACSGGKKSNVCGVGNACGELGTVVGFASGVGETLRCDAAETGDLDAMVRMIWIIMGEDLVWMEKKRRMVAED